MAFSNEGVNKDIIDGVLRRPTKTKNGDIDVNVEVNVKREIWIRRHGWRFDQFGRPTSEASQQAPRRAVQPRPRPTIFRPV
mmetsp:Transcript_22694/g.46225  ORF Transcript_22694/g.46225 Transcript_22694/m.46225 type:complete len:81 (-) Transcript_22694:290-532(-)